MGILSYYDVVTSAHAISFILERNDANRIESIRLEEPLFLCDGKIRVDGDIHFLGEKRSIEKMQGMLTVKKEQEEKQRLYLDLLSRLCPQKNHPSTKSCKGDWAPLSCSGKACQG